MEVYHDPHSEFLGTLRLHQHVLLGTPTAFRIHPHAKSYRIESEFFHQSGALHLLPCCGVELLSVALHLRQPADVRALGVAAFLCRGLVRLLGFRFLNVWLIACRTIWVLLASKQQKRRCDVS